MPGRVLGRAFADLYIVENMPGKRQKHVENYVDNSKGEAVFFDLRQVYYLTGCIMWITFSVKPLQLLGYSVKQLHRRFSNTKRMYDTSEYFRRLKRKFRARFCPAHLLDLHNIV